jgi:hypothetical protein
VALPTEHGGWGFALEPILLGLLVAPSMVGLGLGIAALGIFLVHHPLQLAVRDRMRGKRYPRTVWAERFAIGYAGTAVLAFGLSLVSTQSGFLVPLLIAVPFALVQIIYTVRNRGREMLPEFSGAVALAGVAPAIALASGWAAAPAFALWGLLIVRATASILYVRARLRLERGEAADIRLALAAHGAGVLAIGALAAAGLLPGLAVVAVMALLARAAYGLSSLRKPVRAQVVGFQELGYGLLTVILTALGYRL